MQQLDCGRRAKTLERQTPLARVVATREKQQLDARWYDRGDSGTATGEESHQRGLARHISMGDSAPRCSYENL
jgi:hypothetical protein